MVFERNVREVDLKAKRIFQAEKCWT